MNATNALTAFTGADAGGMRRRFSRRKLRLPLEEPYHRLVIDYLNLIIGHNEQSEEYWAKNLKTSLVRKFEGALTAEEAEVLIASLLMAAVMEVLVVAVVVLISCCLCSLHPLRMTLRSSVCLTISRTTPWTASSCCSTEYRRYAVSGSPIDSMRSSPNTRTAGLPEESSRWFFFHCFLSSLLSAFSTFVNDRRWLSMVCQSIGW